MKRRKAIQSITLSLGGLISLPSWASNWTSNSLPNNYYFSGTENTLLAELVETIIPKTDTPGAKELGTHLFVEKMIADCYDKADQKIFANGLKEIEEIATETFGKNFTSCNTAQRLHILEGLNMHDNDDYKRFYSTLKRLTIQGYMSSEFVLTEIKHFEFAPARYLGCVDVKN